MSDSKSIEQKEIGHKIQGQTGEPAVHLLAFYVDSDCAAYIASS